MKSKKTKRALVSSALALVLCFVMLLGTTFAWFTDNASTSVNKVQAGTLDVQLLDASGKSLEGKTLSWQKAEGGKKQEVLWEPGATYSLQPITIKNNGNLALKYQIVVSGVNGDAKLNEVITWSTAPTAGTSTAEGAKNNLNQIEGTGEYYLLPGAQNTLTISGTMDTAAGNTYQGLSIENVAITVVATQYTYEYDSKDNQYDKNAEYLIPWDGESTTTLTKDAQDGKYHIHSAEELAAFAASVNNGTESYQGKTVVLDNNIDLNNVAWTPIGKVAQDQNNQNNQDNKYFMGTFDGQGHTIYNLYVDKTDTADELGYTTAGLFGWVDAGGCTIQNVNIDGATVKGNHYTGALVGYFSGTIENCSVTNSTVVSVHHDNDNDGDKAGGLVGYMNKGASVKNSSVTNSSIFANRDAGGLVGCTYDSSCTVSGNSVSNTTVNTTKNGDLNCGAVVGRPQGATMSDNKETNVTATPESSVTYVAPGVTKDGKTYYISSAAGLLWFKEQVNSSYNGFNGMTVKLTADIDLNNAEWTPIGQTGATEFAGTFDGDGHTIKNLKVETATTVGEFYASGLFGWLKGTVKDVTIDGATISANHNVGVIAGYIENGSVTGCSVKNATITASHYSSDLCGDKAGALIGYMNGGFGASVTNCSATDCTVKAARDAGQLIGCAQLGSTVDNCTATNVTVSEVESSTCDHSGKGQNIRNEIIGRDLRS